MSYFFLKKLAVFTSLKMNNYNEFLNIRLNFLLSKYISIQLVFLKIIFNSTIMKFSQLNLKLFIAILTKKTNHFDIFLFFCFIIVVLEKFFHLYILPISNNKKILHGSICLNNYSTYQNKNNQVTIYNCIVSSGFGVNVILLSPNFFNLTIKDSAFYNCLTDLEPGGAICIFGDNWKLTRVCASFCKSDYGYPSNFGQFASFYTMSKFNNSLEYFEFVGIN